MLIRLRYQITDGVNVRCFVAIVPTTVTAAAPVLYFSHGSGGSAWKCGEAPDLQGQRWIDIAEECVVECGAVVLSSTSHSSVHLIADALNRSLPRENDPSYCPSCMARKPTNHKRLTCCVGVASLSTTTNGSHDQPITCVRACHVCYSGIWCVPVSYTHLTLPTIYSV